MDEEENLMGVTKGRVRSLRLSKKQKLRLDLIPPEAEIALASVLMHGAGKYGERQWEREPWEEQDIIAAAQRHVLRHRMGEKLDKESGLPHLWHALTCLAMVIAYDRRQLLKSPKRSKKDKKLNHTKK